MEHCVHLCINQEDQAHQLYFHKCNPRMPVFLIPGCNWFCCLAYVEMPERKKVCKSERRTRLALEKQGPAKNTFICCSSCPIFAAKGCVTCNVWEHVITLIFSTGISNCEYCFKIIKNKLLYIRWGYQQFWRKFKAGANDIKNSWSNSNSQLTCFTCGVVPTCCTNKPYQHINFAQIGKMLANIFEQVKKCQQFSSTKCCFLDQHL